MRRGVKGAARALITTHHAIAEAARRFQHAGGTRKPTMRGEKAAGEARCIIQAGCRRVAPRPRRRSSTDGSSFRRSPVRGCELPACGCLGRGERVIRFGVMIRPDGGFEWKVLSRIWLLEILIDRPRVICDVWRGILRKYFWGGCF